MKQLPFPQVHNFYQGKVRDVYKFSSGKLVMVASDRISAFDVILPRTIPFKGQVLNQIAAYMLENCRDICPIWLEATPAPNVSIGKSCEPYKVEVVVRAHLTGHAWRVYKAGGRELCGVSLPDGMLENQPFPSPIITPSTKASEGHDEDISEDMIISTGLVPQKEWDLIKKYAFAIFERGREIASRKGLILVDTKYEFGKYQNDIYLLDEIHTPDSSRYFYKEGFNERLATGAPQQQLSKEFVREWLIEQGFMGKDGQKIPAMTDEWVNIISQRYIKLYETLIGERFQPAIFSEEDIMGNTIKALEMLSKSS